jgi:hypothetical protein
MVSLIGLSREPYQVSLIETVPIAQMAAYDFAELADEPRSEKRLADQQLEEVISDRPRIITLNENRRRYV